MVCPLAKLQVNVQLLMLILPVLVIVTLAPKPPVHWSVIAYCTEQASPVVTVCVAMGVDVGVGVDGDVEVGVGVGVELLVSTTSIPLTLALSLTLLNWMVICP